MSSVEVSAPGSLMLLGEHAVLHGRRALACAVDCRVRVGIAPRTDARLLIRSALGSYDGPVERFAVDGPLRFVLAAVREARPATAAGLEIDIASDFSHRVGLGSSAAVTAATVAALQALAGRRQSLETFKAALRAVRAVQGLGSGADVAASVWGGVVAYRAEPFDVRSLDVDLPLTLVYSGSKTPTPEVVRKVEAARMRAPRRFEALFDRMDASVTDAEEAIAAGQVDRLGTILTRNQGLMREMGVSNDALEAIVAMLMNAPGIAGAKISGSGLGDCVVGLGEARFDPAPYERIPVALSPEGVRIEG